MEIRLFSPLPPPPSQTSTLAMLEISHGKTMTPTFEEYLTQVARGHKDTSTKLSYELGQSKNALEPSHSHHIEADELGRDPHMVLFV